jgi:hypothetical protein
MEHRMITPEKVLSSIFSGDLSHKAQGFLAILPQGYRLEGLVGRIATKAYGSHAHPDIRRLSPEGAGRLISVDTIRDVQPFLASSPAGDGMKTLVIFDAHRMNDNAANALLKPLEEPTKSTRILLLTDKPSALPTTIRSRCSTFVLPQCADLAKEEVTERLGEEVSAKEADIESALRFADGDPTLAASLIEHDLIAWAKKVAKWLGSSDETPPLPTLTGKTAAPLAAVGLSLQSLLMQAARAEDGTIISGWSSMRASEAAWIVMEGLCDVGRAGIDAKTRLHSLMVRAKTRTA